jgi:peptide/nickel transport system substrate-binding protein
MNGFRQLSVILSALIMVVTGCGKPTASAPAQGHPLPTPLIVQCEPGYRGGRLTLVTAGAPRTFNPLLAQDAVSDEAVRLIFGSLVNLDLTTLEPKPGLAESWSVKPDGKTWTFKLRPGLRWSDGVPLTADDVVFTWNEVMYNPDMNRMTYDVFRIGGKNFEVSKVDDLTVRVVTPEVFAPFVEYFGSVAIFPKHIIGQAVQTRSFLSVYPIGARPQQIVGCGPFRVKESQPGRSVLFERNPEYWEVDKQGQRLPYFDEILLKATRNDSPASIFLEAKADLFEQPRPEEYTRFKSAAAGGKFRVLDLGVGAEREFLWFNMNTGNNAKGQPIASPLKLKWFRNKKGNYLQCYSDF